MKNPITLDSAEDAGFDVPTTQSAPTAPPATSQPAAQPPKASEPAFPENLADCFALLKQLDEEMRGTPDVPGSPYRALRKRREDLAAHTHAIQQGPSAPSHLDHLAKQRAWSKASARTELLLALADSGDAQAKKEIEAIRASSARHAAKRPARKLGKGLRDRIAGNAYVQKSIAAAAEAGDSFRQTFIGLDESLFFEEKARSCEIALDSATGNQVPAIRARLFKLRAPGADAARRAAQVSVAESFKPLAAALSKLIDAARTHLRDLESEIEVAEHALYEGFGLPRRETSLATHVKSIAGKLDEFESTLSAQEQRPHTLSPAVGEAILEFFSL